MVDTVWFDDYINEEESADTDISEYDISAIPNDFNILTIFNFIESGAIRIPGFQRNYVWDISRASKLVESLILGLPVPQIFLYEDEKNKFLVIDGQQRLMSIYYFVKQRFPKKDKRAELRAIFAKNKMIPDDVLYNDDYFDNFKLKLSSPKSDAPNKFKGLNYSTLDEYKVQFEMRTVRNVVIRQIGPKDDDSSMYEIFNRLNTGGINLKPQEIRTSMYHSDFYTMLERLNFNSDWRRVLRSYEQDTHMKDVEILLRAFAMLINGEQYAPSMVNFLNTFSRKEKKATPERVAYLEGLFLSFLNACSKLPDTAFVNKKTSRFNIALFEATFVATCKRAHSEHRPIDGDISYDLLMKLQDDSEFNGALQEGTAQAKNVKKRLERASSILTSL